MGNEINGERFFKMISNSLDERMTRLVASAAALGMKYGGISQAARLSGLSRPSIYAGMEELKSQNTANEEGEARQRKIGGGRKSIDNETPEILEKLESLTKPYERGNPESPLRWTSRSLRKLSEEMKRMGYGVSHMTVGKLLEKLGYTLQSNKKSQEGGNSPDRDAQFKHIKVYRRKPAGYFS